MSELKSKRIFYLDALRALAILAVIIIHVNSITNMHVMSEYNIIPSLKWIFSQFSNNCFRIGVDLFLMLAGALSLGRVWTIREFLSKRISRIVAPYIFWGLVTGFITVILCYYFGFKPISNFDVRSILFFIKGVFMAESRWFSQYWFFWMILGTYLIMPIFNKWLLNADLAEAEYFMIFWLITCLFDYTLNMEFPIKLSYFTSPIGLVVAGYYLRHTKRKILNNPYFAFLMIIIPSAIMMVLATDFSTSTSFYTFSRYSFFIAVEVMGIFLLFKNLKIDSYSSNKFSNASKRLIFDIAKYSYGIYLIHGLFLHILGELLPYNNYYLNFLEIFIFTFICSMITMYLFERIPYVKMIIGAK